MKRTDQILNVLRDTVARLAGGRPPLRSITVHPADYRKLSESCAEADVGALAPFILPGVAVFVSELVPRGQAIPDPPDAIDPRVLEAMRARAARKPPRMAECQACHGTGAAPGDFPKPIVCSFCRGDGEIEVEC